MRASMLLRVALAALLAAGTVASLIAYRSEHRLQQAFVAGFEGKSRAQYLALVRDSGTLNPDSHRASIEALLLAGSPARAEAILAAALRREPENASLWVQLAQLQRCAGRRSAALSSYRRAKALDSQLLRSPLPRPGLNAPEPADCARARRATRGSDGTAGTGGGE